MRTFPLRPVLTLTVAIGFAVGGCGGGKARPADDTAPPTTRQVVGPGERDREFVRQAAELNLYQVEAGQLAARRAHTDRVRNLGRLLARDHEEVQGKLQALAEEKGIRLPRRMADRHAELMRRLAGLAGAGFDREYLNQSLVANGEVGRLYTREANDGEDPGIRQLAQEALPDLAEHERHIEQLRPGTWSSPAKPTGDEGK